MFIHIGSNIMVNLDHILFILNRESDVKINRINLEEQWVDGDNYKSIVVTDNKIYYSPISSQTLRQRVNFVKELNN